MDQIDVYWDLYDEYTLQGMLDMAEFYKNLALRELDKINENEIKVVLQ